MDRSFLNAVIGVIAIFVFGAFLMLKPSDPRQYNEKFQEIFTVNMPRPIKEFLSGFSMEDRVVTRLVIDSEKKLDPKKVVAPVNGKNGTQAAVDAKKTKAEKQRQDLRRRQYLQKQATERAFKMRIVQESERYRRELIKRNFEQSQNDMSELKTIYAGNKKLNLAPEAFQPDAQEEKEVLTADQWKSLILSQPTRENVQRLVEAFQKNEIDLESYLQIAEVLIQDNSEEKKRIGIWALTATSSVQSFSLAVKLSSTQNADNQKILKDYLFSYNRPQALGSLEQALRSPDIQVRSLAAQIITEAIDKIKAGESLFSNASRSQRPEGSTVSSLAVYRRLVPTLQWLVSNPNSGLLQWAQGLLSQLQSSTTPA